VGHAHGGFGADSARIRAAEGEKIRRRLHECALDGRTIPVENAGEAAQSAVLSIE
jgi:hypothetical protein